MSFNFSRRMQIVHTIYLSVSPPPNNNGTGSNMEMQETTSCKLQTICPIPILGQSHISLLRGPWYFLAWSSCTFLFLLLTLWRTVSQLTKGRSIKLLLLQNLQVGRFHVRPVHTRIWLQGQCIGTSSNARKFLGTQSGILAVHTPI